MTREEAIARFGKPDRNGHIERYSDSSFYDGVCVMCGCTDADPAFRKKCPNTDADEAIAAGPVIRFMGTINEKDLLP
jgi:hypothetical protein